MRDLRKLFYIFLCSVRFQNRACVYCVVQGCADGDREQPRERVACLLRLHARGELRGDGQVGEGGGVRGNEGGDEIGGGRIVQERRDLLAHELRNDLVGLRGKLRSVNRKVYDSRVDFWVFGGSIIYCDCATQRLNCQEILFYAY